MKIRKISYKKLIKFYIILLVISPISFAAPTLSISQVPLVLSNVTARPEVLIALGNSESMDGILSGAILTGSGSLGTTLSLLNNSSSPINYVVPSGFTPPVQAANASNLAPYTVNKSGVLYDNGPSRLNVAKAGIQAIVQNFLPTTDFGLETYTTSSLKLYITWVYYMSPQAGNFAFTNTPNASNRYVTNPCYGYLSSNSTTVNSNCSQIASLYGGSSVLSNSQYMQISASSDDSTINDVLYAGTSIPAVFVSYNGPTPSTPYPPSFSLANYNSGSVQLTYKNTSPSFGAFSSSPTNAGFVPFTPQVMYAERGFGYGASQSATTGSILVPMTNLGNNPSTTAVNNALNTFINYLKPETNQTSTTEIKASAGQSPTAGLLTRALSYLSGLTSTGSTCPPKKYVILISDGLPTLDLSGKIWPPLGSAAATGYGVTATFNANGSLKSTNNQAVIDTINAITNLSNAGIKTFIIGLGAGVDPTFNAQAANTLTAMAIAGGTTNYYPATSPASLVNELNNILIVVQNGTFSLGAAAVSASSVQNGTVAYQASFTSSDIPYQDWTGQLIAVNLDTTTSQPLSTQLWSAQSLLDTKVQGTGWQAPNRIIATWNPTLNSNVGAGAPFEWTNLNPTQQTLLQPSDTLGQNRLQYLRGDTSLEVRNGGTFRNRSHILGDIVDSQVLYVGTPNKPYLYNTSYQSFITSQTNRLAMVYVGANDGMLHAFDATTGVERFAFVPNAVIKNLANLTATTYNQSHLFFVDGSPQSGDVQFSDGSWHTLVVSGEHAGGNSIFALDVTNPAAISSEAVLASDVLWEFTDGDMGLSYSDPQIAPVNPSTTTLQTFAVFFGNGYNSPNNKAILYALNPQTGAVLAKLDLCAAVPNACNANLPQGLSTVAVATLDGIQGQAISRVYAGDLQGNLWVVDVSSGINNVAQWSIRRLFQATDSAKNVQPITTQPIITLQPNYPRQQGLFIMFGTGALLTSADLTNQQVQTIYGIWDNPTTNNTNLNRANLTAQTLNIVSAATSGLSQDILTATSNTVNFGGTNVGWYVDLPIAGQRLIYNPQLLNGALIMTLLTPPASTCSNTFTSTLLELKYSTGGAFSSAQLDLNNNGVISNSEDNYGGIYPVGFVLQSGLVSAPTILPGLTKNNTIIKLFTHQSGKQISVINPNNAPRTTSWWQLQ
ncbi:pilus assembly protein (plasmid) [Legionella sp. D16C41]|uniref:pilus assembly protein n=1 Tax=Legionella sp. D16C41 TaxID=3402688 RepID=UPI003AF5204E